MKKVTYAVVFSSVFLLGCASKDYALYAETQKSIAQYRSAADSARFAALAEIAKTGDSAAKVAAVISLNMMGSQAPNTAVQAPKSVGDTVLQWASILLPNMTQIYGIHKNADVSISQSNNAALVARSTNETFLGIAGKIQAPQASVITSTTNTSTIGGNNNTGSNSGNSGRIAGYDLIDNTATPTVVKPEVINTTTTTTTTNTTNSNNTTSGTGGP